MAVGTWQDPDHETQTGTAYKMPLDNAIAVAKRYAAAFAPHEAAPADFTVVVDPGFVWDGTTLTEVAQQVTAAIALPAADQRISRVVVDRATGAVSVVDGADAPAPVPPAVPAGNDPVARIGPLTTTTPAITNALIADERVFRAPSKVPRNYIDGLGLANNAVDALKDIDIRPGVATDDTNSVLMERSGTLVKQLDTVWAAGTNQGGRDAGGGVGGNSWYHVWLIRRSDTGVVDALFSLSAATPTMPPSYDQKRRIGAVLTDSSANIIKFFQLGDLFLWDMEIEDFEDLSMFVSPVTITLSVPTGLRVLARITSFMDDFTYGARSDFLLNGLDQTARTPGVSNRQFAIIGNAGEIEIANVAMEILTDTSAQMRAAVAPTNGDVGIIIWTLGWHDPRGKDWG